MQEPAELLSATQNATAEAYRAQQHTLMEGGPRAPNYPTPAQTRDGAGGPPMAPGLPGQLLRGGNSGSEWDVPGVPGWRKAGAKIVKKQGTRDRDEGLRPGLLFEPSIGRDRQSFQVKCHSKKCHDSDAYMIVGISFGLSSFFSDQRDASASPNKDIDHNRCVYGRLRDRFQGHQMGEEIAVEKTMNDRGCDLQAFDQGSRYAFLESKEDRDTDDKNGEICIIIDVVETSSKPRAKAFRRESSHVIGHSVIGHGVVQTNRELHALERHLRQGRKKGRKLYTGKSRRKPPQSASCPKVRTKIYVAPELRRRGLQSSTVEKLRKD
ncbi:hypothetical protein B0H14DRAFT_3126602 [Mycena olivaceomarginata]|nr:hypothetical protein B0H14DRAFT_3126602 [Mycena olivaceomarginata]